MALRDLRFELRSRPLEKRAITEVRDVDLPLALALDGIARSPGPLRDAVRSAIADLLLEPAEKTAPGASRERSIATEAVQSLVGGELRRSQALYRSVIEEVAARLAKTPGIELNTVNDAEALIIARGEILAEEARKPGKVTRRAIKSALRDYWRRKSRGDVKTNGK